VVAFGSGLCSRSLPVRCGHLSWWQSELGFRRAVTRNERERESGRDCQHFFFSFPLLRIGEHRNHNQEGELPHPPHCAISLVRSLEAMLETWTMVEENSPGMRALVTMMHNTLTLTFMAFLNMFSS
jgi:hypothetical protein